MQISENFPIKNISFTEISRFKSLLIDPFQMSPLFEGASNSISRLLIGTFYFVQERQDSLSRNIKNVLGSYEDFKRNFGSSSSDKYKSRKRDSKYLIINIVCNPICYSMESQHIFTR